MSTLNTTAGNSKAIRFMTWVCFVILFCSNSMHATTISSRGGSGNWSDTAHWSPAQIPTTSDSVIITSGNNMTISGYNAYAKGLNVQSGATLTNKNTLTYALNLYGNLKVDGTYSCGGVTYETQVGFYGAGSHICGGGTISTTYNCYFCIRANVSIDAGTTTSGAIDFILYGAVTLLNNGSVTSISGAYGISFNGGGGGTWTQGVNSYFGGHGIGGPNSGTLDASASGNTVEYSYSNASIYQASPGYYNLKISGSGNSPVLAGNIQVLGDFTIVSGGMTASSYIISLKGNWYNYGTAYTNAGQPKMNFNGTGTQTIYKSSTAEYYNDFTLSGTSTVTPPLGGLEVNNLIINSGATFDMGSASLLEVYANWTNYGTFIPRTSITYLCPYVGYTDTVYNSHGTETFFNLGKLNPGTTKFKSNIKVTSTTSVSGVLGFSIGAGTVDAGNFSDTISVAGNWLDNGTFIPGNSTVILTASWASRYISKPSAPETFYNLINSTSAWTTLYYSISCANNLVINGTEMVQNGGSSISVGGNLSIGSGATLYGYAQLITLGGNWTNNGTYYCTTGSQVILNGLGTQTINKGSGTETFRKLTVNKSAGTVTLNCPLNIPDTLHLIRAQIVTTSTNLLSLNNGTGLVGGSDTAYVSGAMGKYGNTAFTFPLGSTALTTGAYHPLSITAPSATTDEFVAQYYPTGQTYGTTRADSIEGISSCEYWTLNHTAGTSTVSVGLNFNTNCPVQGNANISLASWNGTTWLDRNGTKSFGNWPKGSVTMTSPMSVSGLVPFALIYKQITGGYAELKRKLDGGYFIVPKGTLYFKFDDEYNSGSPHLTYQLYNGSRQDLSASLISYDPASSNPVTIYGDNRFGLDMSTSGGALSSGYYVLEVTNEKSEKRYLRVKMP